MSSTPHPPISFVALFWALTSSRIPCLRMVTKTGWHIQDVAKPGFYKVAEFVFYRLLIAARRTLG